MRSLAFATILNALSALAGLAQSGTGQSLSPSALSTGLSLPGSDADVPTIPAYLNSPKAVTGLYASRTAARVSEPGRSYIGFTGDSANRWQPSSLNQRDFLPNGALRREYSLNYANPTDTLWKVEYTYTADGALAGLRRWRVYNGTYREFFGEAYTYDAQGHMVDYVQRWYDNYAQGIDTTSYTTYTHSTDALGRIALTFYTRVNIRYTVNGNGDTIRVRGAPLRYRDSVFYASPSSRLLAGQATYSYDGAGYIPYIKNRYRIDSVTNKPWEWTQWFVGFGNRFHLYMTNQYRTLPNGSHGTTRYIYDTSVDTVRVRENIEYRYEDRLNGTWNDAPNTAALPELNNLISTNIKRLTYNNRTPVHQFYDDSLQLDAENRVLVRAQFRESNTADTNSGANRKFFKYVFTELGLVGLRPSTAPQTLAIAPGPSTQTVLLPALPYGLWQATLVDMQGRASSLGSPNKTGILTMPSLATGVYSLHLKDKTGRHLHGRFVWQQ